MEDPKTALALHRFMMLSRVLDEAGCQGPARWHTSRGEEAVPVGTFYGLRPRMCAP
jgi:hypothetical protein